MNIFPPLGLWFVIHSSGARFGPYYTAVAAGDVCSDLNDRLMMEDRRPEYVVRSREFLRCSVRGKISRLRFGRK